MSDKKDTSRADEIFNVLNEFREEQGAPAPESGIETDSGDAEQAIDILSNGKDDSDEEVPLSIFSHLSEEGEGVDPAPIPPSGGTQEGGDSHFSGHFSAVEEGAELPPLPADDNPAGDDGDSEEDDDEEKVSKPKKVWNFFKNMSFIPKAIVFISIILLVSAYLSYYIITIANDVFALVTDSREVMITIEEGATDESVGELLEAEGVIEYAWVYELYMKYRGDGDESTDYIIGTHKINTDYNYSQIISALTKTGLKYSEISLTIPEGFTVDQIIDLLISNGLGQKEDYIKAVNEYPFKHEFVRLLDEQGYSEHRKYRLEGYLFPDTYTLYTEEYEANLNYVGEYDYEVYVVNTFLNAFDKKFWKDFARVDNEGDSYQKMVLEDYGLTFDDLIVLASMIQSEGGNATDFELISFVFHNRLSHASSFPKLESDATIQYVLPERITDSSQIDISFDSPYNTYLHDGLPPGAISNPGTDALTAAMFPVQPTTSGGSKINAYFFVSNDAGKTYYAATKSSHNKNIAQVKKDNEAIKAGTYEG